MKIKLEEKMIVEKKIVIELTEQEAQRFVFISKYCSLKVKDKIAEAVNQVEINNAAGMLAQIAKEIQLQ